MELKIERPNKSGRMFFHIRQGDYEKPHSHEGYYEFLFMISGKITHTVNGTEKPLEPNTLCLVRPTDIHMTVSENPEKVRYAILGVVEDVFNSAIDLLFYKNIKEIYDFIDYDVAVSGIKAQEIMREIMLILYSEPRHKPKYTATLFLTLLKEFVLQNELRIRKFTRHRNPAISELMQVLDSPEYYTLELEQVIKKTNYSYSHMNKIFKKELGISPSEYLKRKKLEYAQLLLKESDMPFADVAKAIGYSSYPHFSIFFKNGTGISPTEYVKKSNAKKE